LPFPLVLLLLLLLFPFPMPALLLLLLLLLFPGLNEGDPGGLPLLLLLLAAPLISTKVPGADFGVVGERGVEDMREWTPIFGEDAMVDVGCA
jgi:hypothetical protein